MKNIQELNENLLTTLNNVVENFLNNELKKFPDLFKQYTKQTMLLTSIIYNDSLVDTYIFNIDFFNSFDYENNNNIDINKLLYDDLEKQIKNTFIKWLKENNFDYQAINNKDYYFEKFADDIIYGCTFVDTEY